MREEMIQIWQSTEQRKSDGGDTIILLPAQHERDEALVCMLNSGNFFVTVYSNSN